MLQVHSKRPHPDQDPIVLVCAADDNYAMGLGVTVASALANLKHPYPIQLFVIDGGISPVNRRRLEQTCGSQAELTWLTPGSQVQSLHVSGHLTSATYYRLLIPELLPHSITKVIYLDSDLIVQGNLADLWNQPVGDYFALAVRDINTQIVSSKHGLLNYQELGIPSDTGYFNAGVLVINLEQWRRTKIAQRTIAYIRDNPHYVRWHDQDGLNAMFAGHWGDLNPQWNRASTLHRYASWQDSPYNQFVYEQLLTQPYIIHFVESGKPWTPGFQHPEKYLFFHYLKRTAWSCWQVQLQFIWQRCQAKINTLIQPKMSCYASSKT
ncbi:MAG: glycosyltransferase family 8 protein [Oculatellaceae cyanobacterium bins.114]|nr:glycosyltransferase family 8 protein [Oculatellaceae cyanobacterium bins.114]